MAKDFYTFLIIPKKQGSIKKVTISGAILKGVAFCLAVIILCTIYTYCDYIKIKSEIVELTNLRQQTKEHKTQIDNLAEKVNNFSERMDEIRQLDKQIRVLANVEDKSNSGQILGIGGSLSSESVVKSHMETDQKMIIAHIDRNVDQLMGDANDQRRSYYELLRFLKEQKSIREATPSIWPVKGWVTSQFGNRVSPLGRTQEFHRGIDIATTTGVPVVAPADGIVADVAYDRDLGHIVRINHGHGMVTWYGHLLKSAVKDKNLVKRGTVIGYVGNSGRSTGSHLHYSVFLNGVPVNPRKYLN
jgi:murein DD-endopeptidase MepM/ murein hydrolase activator NlpD